MPRTAGARPVLLDYPRPQWTRAFRQPSTSFWSSDGLQALRKSAWALYWLPEES